MTNCPICGKEIASYEYNGIQFKICKSCSAVVITEDSFNKLTLAVDNDNPVIDLFALPTVNAKEVKRECINCNKDMHKIFYEGIVLDRCDKCRLLIFDNGELSKFFNKFSKKPIDIMNNALFIKTYCKGAKLTEKNIENKTTVRKRTNTRLNIQPKEIEKAVAYSDGWAMLGFLIFIILISIALLIFNCTTQPIIPISAIVGILLLFLSFFLLGGFKILKPQEAIVFTLFGKYCGTLRNQGFYWVNPFANASFGITSLKTRTLDNGKQKINDAIGNPIEVGIMVTWEVRDTAKALFNVNDYKTFLSAQCDSALRNIVRLYPYDAPENSEQQTLKGDSAEISDKLKEEIQDRVSIAGLYILDARITHLAYSSEIAMAMLQRQQANAVLDAKRTIVEGAVGMVEMALDRLSNNQNVTLDEKTKANMVNNLLVVLCSNKDTQPVIRNDVL